MSRSLDVAAAVLLRENEGKTEYLLARRPEGKVYAGYWEFPGGKVEAGESLREALDRELHEELGITVEKAWPWLSCEFTYPHAHVRLRFFRVASWRGDLVQHEHSGLVWTALGENPDVTPVLPANGPILQALALPAQYLLTHAGGNGLDGELARVDTALDAGQRLIQIRDKELPPDERFRLARGVMERAAAHPGSVVLVNDDETLARRVGAHGVHLSSQRLIRSAWRPEFSCVAASCHTPEELRHAAALGLDFVVFGPVLPTLSHPGAPGIGWPAFAQSVERYPLPVYALGGMTMEILDTARGHGAHGLALMRGWG